MLVAADLTVNMDVTINNLQSSVDSLTSGGTRNSGICSREKKPHPIGITMKKLSLLCALALAASAANAQVIISQWNFETNTPADLLDSATGPSVPADVGSGTATGVHASALTDWTTPSGNGSPNAFSSNNWASGDYYQFSLGTIGFDDIHVAFSQTRSSTGPAEFTLQYSTDGTTFSNFANYTVAQVTFSAGVPQPGAVYAFDLGGVAALNNSSTIVFRLVSTVAGTSLGGTNRVDDFTVSDGFVEIAVPEPGTWAMAALGGATMLCLKRRSRTLV